ncbi:MAG: hypothetical protein IJN25_06450 [Clostridia bacterium]|nr:hypothetical protein [Clostridia bacterium]
MSCGKGFFNGFGGREARTVDGHQRTHTENRNNVFWRALEALFVFYDLENTYEC